MRHGRGSAPAPKEIHDTIHIAILRQLFQVNVKSLFAGQATLHQLCMRKDVLLKFCFYHIPERRIQVCAQALFVRAKIIDKIIAPQQGPDTFLRSVAVYWPVPHAMHVLNALEMVVNIAGNMDEFRKRIPCLQLAWYPEERNISPGCEIRKICELIPLDNTQRIVHEVSQVSELGLLNTVVHFIPHRTKQLNHRICARPSKTHIDNKLGFATCPFHPQLNPLEDGRRVRDYDVVAVRFRLRAQVHLIALTQRFETLLKIRWGSNF
mmetsp:Transcript_31265/g.89676  ORF Transcript_31265/g.89676 Transcript_31265/m.89676 type:complete len:265 (-) Transcript_31265:120-914(-)